MLGTIIQELSPFSTLIKFSIDWLSKFTSDCLMPERSLSFCTNFVSVFEFLPSYSVSALIVELKVHEEKTINGSEIIGTGIKKK